MRTNSWKQLVLVLFLLAALPGCCQSSPTTPGKSMKGYELYSWQAQGDWRFALVVGTNRLKTFDEISSDELRLQALERKLDQLPGGEQVFWSTQRVPNMALPPSEMIAEIRAFCAQRDIQLEIEPVPPLPPSSQP